MNAKHKVKSSLLVLRKFFINTSSLSIRWWRPWDAAEASGINLVGRLGGFFGFFFNWISSKVKRETSSSTCSHMFRTMLFSFSKYTLTHTIYTSHKEKQTGEKNNLDMTTTLKSHHLKKTKFKTFFFFLICL